MDGFADYECVRCGAGFERWVSLPPPATTCCLACGAESRRVHRTVSVARRWSSPVPFSGASRARLPLCQANPDVPLLCHMEPAAARLWVARARGDGRALERELAAQEARLGSGSPPPSPVLGRHHHHHHGGAGAGATEVQEGTT
ncbi:MAG TPA: zinc ribbon domain-containing protein [Candidatus Dormibacteraeota bacterium]|nr:zinc ribbon domain-containing protein [Candidatus Dormibacteraeota bacterium]